MSKYRGSFEERAACALQRHKIEFTYELEHIPYTIPSTQHKYKPDFVFQRPDGHTIYVETKGYFDGEDRKKQALIHDQHPDLDIRMIFQKGNTPLVSKKKRGKKVDGTPMNSMTYGEWCDKRGIEWESANTIAEIGRVVKKWYHEADE